MPKAILTSPFKPVHISHYFKDIPAMKDNTMVILPNEQLAIRIFFYSNGDALYLFGDGRIMRLGAEFPTACAWRVL